MFEALPTNDAAIQIVWVESKCAGARTWLGTERDLVIALL